MKTITKFIAALLISFPFAVLNAQPEQPMMGQAAPSFTLTGLDGKTYSLEQFRGKFVVIHFATTWCPFCNAEAPNLEQLYKAYKLKDVQVFIIDKEGTIRFYSLLNTTDFDAKLTKLKQRLDELLTPPSK